MAQLKTKLTPYQLIFYYEWLHHPERSDYNIVIDNTISGPLDPQKFNDSFEKMLNEHFIMRHTVANDADGIFWVMREPMFNVTTFHDAPLSSAHIHGLVTAPFDLEKGPLVRVHLIKLAEQQHRMVCVFHHIVVDGISTEEIWAKWRHNYNGVAYPVPTLQQQTEMHQTLYETFDHVLASRKEAIRQFWQTHLTDVQGIDLGFLKTKQSLDVMGLSTITEAAFGYDEQVYEQVRQLRRQYKITPYIFGQLVMAVLLHKMSGQHNVPIAYPIAILEGKELQYGAHVNTMVIDYRFGPQATLQSLIDETVAFYKTIKTSGAKYLPIQDIVSFADDPGVLGVAFAQTFFRDHALGLTGVVEQVNHEFHIDLASTLLFEQEEHDRRLNYRVRYDQAVLNPALVAQFIGLYQHLFVQLLDYLLADQGGVLVDDIDLIVDHTTTAEPEALLAPLPEHMVARFEAMVAAHPERTALVYQSQRLSYRELNERVNRFAHYLHTRFDCQPDDLIALYLDKSEHMLVAILAVLKSGAAYVPIDPNTPAQRLQFVLQDTQAKALLTQTHYLADLDAQAAFEPAATVAIDDASFLEALQTDYSADNLAVDIQPAQLAYVIYTSGTTGVPKGVMLAHQGLTHLAMVQGQALGLANQDQALRQLWYAAYIFDAHVSEVFTALAYGHTLYLLEEAKRLDFQALATYISEHRIDVATIPPALLDKVQLLPLTTLIVAGEVCSLEIMNRYRGQNTVVVNAYGPTESTVCATLNHYEVGDGHTNIGRPLAHITTHVLDQRLKPVPVGVMGELYLGGEALARGYWQNAQETERAFIPNPFQSQAQKQQNVESRLYRTGDLVRQLSNGQIEYMGRKDFQVSIRGFRIELGEIETRLTQLEGVTQAVAVAHTLGSGLKTLLAYYVSAAPLPEVLITAHLNQSLPEYMMPSAFIHLSGLPMTVNGKLDKTALPLPSAALNAHAAYRAPENAVEAQLCRIFAEVLGLEPEAVGVDADFFKFGGDSISGIQLVSRVRQQMHAAISIQDVFTHKTIRVLAQNLCVNQGAQVSVIAEQGQLSGSVKLLPIQQWFFNQVAQGRFQAPEHWNQTFVLHVPELNVRLLQLSLNQLFAQHDALRMAFAQQADGSHSQYYRPDLMDLPFDVVTAQQRDQEGVSEAALFNQWQQGFDLTAGRLCHIAYLEGYAGAPAKLHFAFHHLIIDAISWQVIKQDLQAIYQALCQDDAQNLDAILGDKQTSYRQWVAQVQDYANQQAAQDEPAYWQALLQEMAPYQHAVRALSTNALSQCRLSLSAEDTLKLQRHIHHVYGTQVHDVLLGALTMALSDLIPHTNHYVTLEGHGREHVSRDVDISRTVGWFTHMYPVRLKSNNTLAALLGGIKASMSAVPNRGIGFGPLLGYADAHLAPIGFNYLGQFDGDQQGSWQFGAESAGVAMSPRNHDANVLSLNCGIVHGVLTVQVAGYLSEAQVQAFANGYMAHVRAMITQLLAQTRRYLTVTDIDGVVSADALDQIQQGQEVEAVYLANSLQQGFIYHALTQGETDDAYRTQMFWDYHRALNVDVLQQAWQHAQARFPVLRLRFGWDEELVQIIDQQAVLNWRCVDVSDREPEAQQQLIDDLIEQDRQQPYDLARSGLFRVLVIKRQSAWYQCVFSSHHAILDGWSNPILVQAVHEAYVALLAGQTLTADGEQAYGQVQQYVQQHQDEHVAYWHTYVQGLAEPEDLSLLLRAEARHIRLNEYKHIVQPQQRQLRLTGAAYHNVKAFTAAHGLTANALLQYCWHKALSVFTGASASIVGMVVSGRNLPVAGIEHTVGLLINTLPIIVDHATEATMVTLIQQLQEDIHQANGRSHVNLAALQPSGERLFDSLFVFENYPMPETDLGEQLGFGFKGSQEKQDYPLVMTVFDHEDQFLLGLNYAGELFAPELMQQLLAQMQWLVTQIVAEPTMSSHALAYLDAPRQQQVLQDWNATHQAYDHDQSIAALFEAQVRHAPDAPALVCQGKTWSYAELNERANQLAHCLCASGEMTANDFIGLYLERTAWMVISILAVLKTGAAYVPMDPAAPRERNEYIIQNARPKALVCDAHHQPLWAQAVPELKAFGVGEPIFDAALNRYPDTNLAHVGQAHDLAYVIYTSGTTGQPKGTLIDQGNVTSLVLHANYVTLDADDRLLSISGYQFDASTYDIFGALLNGASLVLADKDTFLDLSLFNQLLHDQKITNFFATTAFFNTLVDAELPHLAGLSHVLFGGELVSTGHVNRFRALYPEVKLVHVYGPTETTTYATAYLTNQATEAFTHTVPIGHPLNNTSLYVLDAQQRPVPVGAVGELYIGGAGVGQGYLHHSDLTQQVFMANPFQTDTELALGYNGRLYKTGDLVRHRPDGAVEYLGRNDFQVKIRGFRIELGEIEAKLISHDHIKQAIVVALDGSHGVKYLAAYYVADAALTTDELLAYLGTSLPDYMLPSALVALPALPLNINGKVDRRALPVPTLSQSDDYEAPTTADETALAMLYAEFLGLPVDTIGVTDDFFRLGGNSILAIKLASHISKQRQQAVHVNDIFSHKTIRALAAALAQNQREQLLISAPEVTDPQQQLLSFAQERLWFIDCYEGGSNAYNIPIVFELMPTTQPGVLAEALMAVVARHEVLHSLIKTNPQGSGYQEVVSLQDSPMTVLQVACADEAELAAAIEQHVHRVFHLAQEYPLSIQQYRMGQRHYVSLVIHHIAFDGWSIDLLIQELVQHYHRLTALAASDAVGAGQHQLAEVAVQYKEFALWQRQYVQGDVLATQLAYWQQRLTDAEPLNLPTDYPRPAQIDYSGRDLSFALDAELSQQLRALASELNVSLYSLLLSGYYLTLGAFSNQQDLVVGTPIAGRHYPGIEQTMGFFVNTLALRQNIDPAQSLQSFIQAVGLSVSEAQSHQDLPFEKLVDALQLEKDASRHPLFQVMFGVQSFGTTGADQVAELISPYDAGDAHYQVAKFDLTTMLDDAQEAITGSFNYATALFKEDTVKQYVRVYQHLLSQFVGMQSQPLAQLSYLDAASQDTVMQQWNQTQAAYPEGQTLHALFEAQAHKTPDHIALVFETERLSYRMLNERANRLAQYLRQRFELRPDDLVALCLERSEHMLIAMLAVMKAGGAYVPMDPRAPDERIRFMLDDTQAKAVLTTSISLSKVAPLAAAGQAVVVMDEAITEAEIAACAAEDVTPLVQAHHLAYVIYTSGTTGQPKGVMLPHEGVVNLAYASRAPLGLLPLTAGMAVKNTLWLNHYIFDAHVMDIYPVLLSGHALYLPVDDVRYDSELIHDYVVKHHIDNASIPPALLRNDFVIPLRLIALGGDVSNLDAMNLYLDQGVTVLNIYGPTENSVCSTAHVFQPGDSNTNIGRPLSNNRLYVLDAHLRPVPIGGQGELYVGGDGIGRGYLNNPALTAACFVANPFQTASEQAQGKYGRLYKTGDLVKYLANGDIVYLGRNDFQVKIRGFRIELGEIEARLSHYPNVAHAIVLAQENAAGAKYLVAYYVANTALSEQSLAEYLHETLPDYMVPAVFVHLTALPMTANGKLDRKALPVPVLTNHTAYVAPSNDTERLFCGVFADVLKLKSDAISVDDDFFKLGGDSISSIQLANRIRQSLDYHLAIKDVFALKTVQALSAFVLQAQQQDRVVIQSEQGLLTGALPLLPIQKWFFHQVAEGKLPHHRHWNQAFLLDVPALDVALLQLSINKLVAYHDVLRVRYPDATAGEYVEHAELSLTTANVVDMTAAQRTDLLTQWQSDFDLVNGPMAHIAYLDGYERGRGRIHVAVHHLNIDAVSWRMMSHDLQTLYDFFTEQTTLDPSVSAETILGRKGTSYRQWVTAMQAYPQAAVKGHDSESAYWHTIVADVATYNASLNAERTNEAYQAEVSLPKDKTALLLRDIHAVYGTEINDVLLTALSFALQDSLAAPAHYVLLEGHGRETLFDDQDINHTLGWFTCMYPIQLARPQQAMVASVAKVKDMLRAIPHHGIGYGALMGYTEQALPAISFNYLGQFDGGEAQEGWFFSDESSGISIGSGNQTTDFLALNGGVLNGALRFRVEGYLAQPRLQQLAAAFMQRLDALITSLTQVPRSYLTEADVAGVVSSPLLASLQSDTELAGVYLANSLQQGFIYHAITQGAFDQSYRSQMVWDYHNPLEVDLLAQAWRLTQAKHPALRLRFSWAEELLQVIDKQGVLHWHYLDLSDQTPAAQAARCEALQAQDAAQAYDLAEGSLFRVTLVKRGHDDYRCIVNNHHAILDGWSLPILLTDVHQQYLALVAKQPLAFTPDESYANAQAFLQTQTQATHDFWRDHLSAMDTQENLATLLKPQMSHVNLAEYKFIEDHQERSITFSGPQYAALKALCGEQGFTLNALLQYCWHQQLSVYGHTDTTVVGMTVSGRNLPVDGIESSVGLFINTLPIVLTHKAEPVVSLINTLQAHINQINGHSQVNLATLQTEGTRLFSSLFVFENYPLAQEDAQQLRLSFQETQEKLDYPLGVVAFEQADTAVFKIKYAAELFDVATIAQLLQGVQRTVAQLLQQPTIEAHALRLLSDAAYQQLLASGQGDTTAFAQDLRLSQLFEAQAAKTPDQIALVYEGERLSYQALNQRANRLGAYLKATYGIEPDDRIALYLDKSVHMVVSLLAVLKAGAAYVPMSPATPDARIQHMVAEVQPKVVLTHQHHADALALCLGEQAIDSLSVDEAGFIDALRQHDGQDFDTTTQAHHLAYIIYTSGTTGVPKGVMIEHRSLVNMCSTNQAVLGLLPSHGPQDQKNVLWYASYVFDAHAYEVYNALMNGHCLHVLAEHKRLDVTALAAYVSTHAIHFATIPPALLDTHQLLALETLTLAGEVSNGAVMAAYHAQGTRLINAYGPSETTVWATARVYQAGDLNTNIGQAIHNVTTYVLDPYLRPVPQGAIGELYVGGAGVGRGYFNNPELTDQVFLSQPLFGDESVPDMGWHRLYKTGDLVRRLPDDTLAYIGRNDGQVKIRGFRIELGEIEARLITHPLIKQATAQVLAHDNGSHYLVAYYVAEQDLDQTVLLAYLQKALPDYMVPTACVALAALPLTLNGKIDRRALPKPSLGGQACFVAANTDTERQLVLIYADLLAMPAESLSVEDDFFKLGGNSILMIKLSAKIGQQWHKHIDVNAVLAHKTIRALAQFIDHSAHTQRVIRAPQLSHPQQQRLSFAQERLWFIDCYEGGSNAYNMPLLFQTQEGVDLGILAQAMHHIVARHEVLRSLIKTDAEGVGYQQVMALADMPFGIDHVECDSQEAMAADINAHRARVFVLEEEYPLSIRQYTLGQQHYFSVVIHHIAFDGWSVDLLMNELYHHYAHFSARQAGDADRAHRHQLPEVSVQYKDFALWQRDYLQGEVATAQLAYWQQQLAGYEPLNLPTDFVRPAYIDYAGQEWSFALNPVLSNDLRTLAQTLNVSLYSLLLSGYYLMLGAFSNQQDLVVGTPIAGRHHHGIEHTMGFFVNMLVLRQTLDPVQSLQAFIQSTGAAVNQAQQHQDLPFEQLVDVLQVEKDPSRHPVFQTLFSLQSFGQAQAHDIEQVLTSHSLDATAPPSARFDLTVMLDDGQDAIGGVFNYATSLFSVDTIKQYIAVYQHILAQFVEAQARPLAQLHYLNAASYEQVIHAWNDTQRAFPQDVTVHALFEAQAQKTPDNIALVYEHTRLSYRELNERANRLARYLRAQFDICPDDLIGLCLERSEHMLVAILAILKAGGAYVPMDPQAPEDRIRYMLADTQAKVVLTTATTVAKVSALVSTGQTVLNLDDGLTQADVAVLGAHALPPVAQPQHLAYVIYTSGTTGDPKGVMLAHKGVVNRIVWMHEEYPITEQDRILQKTNYTFDVSVWELFWANWYGAAIVFAHSEQYKDNVYLADLIQQEQVSVLHFVPSMLVAFMDTLEAQPELSSQLGGLRYLFCSGEALNLEEVRQCHRFMPECAVHNLYGPTEATVDVLYYDCNQRDLTKVLIGKPIANTSAYVLNASQQPVPIGGMGELYVGGEGVARGYLNNPGLTDDRFVPNPFQTQAERQQHYNGRIYKTGDVVRYLADGQIEYLGRNDFQVKIRGYRIELGEIEARLSQCPEVNHAVVLAYEHETGDKYLVAYYVAEHALASPLMAAHLLVNLPEYMVPSAFVHLSRLPTTSNGKLDRKALPKPSFTQTVAYIAPEGEVEKALCAIHAEVLALPEANISMSDNFFKLGGSSILAIKLTNRINRVLAIKLRLTDVLNAHTLQDLAVKVTQAGAQFNPIVPLNHAVTQPQMFMIHPSLAGCDVYASLATALRNHYHCHGVDAYNLYHDDKIEDFDQLTQYYLDYLNQTRRPGEPVTLLGWSFGGQIALDIAVKLEAQGVEDIKIYLLDTWVLNQADVLLKDPSLSLAHIMDELGIPQNLRAKVAAVAAVDQKLIVQPVSGTLRHAQVTLFKATQKADGALHQKYALNNVDAHVHSLKQLRLIRIDASHHHMLAQEAALVAHISQRD